MNRTFTFFIVLATMIIAIPSFGSGSILLSPAAPMLPKATYEALGLYQPDAVLPIVMSANPAALSKALDLQNAKGGVISNYVLINPTNGPDVRAYYQSIYYRGPVDLRVTFNDLSSSKAPLLASMGMPVNYSGKSIEISASKAFRGGAIGLALVPKDEANITVGDNLVKGSASASFEGRVGTILNNGRTSVGALYSCEKDSSSVTISPFITGVPAPISLQSQYYIKTGVVGVSYTPKLGTLLVANAVEQNVDGQYIHKVIKLPNIGVVQYFNPNFGVYLSSINGGANTVSAFYQKGNCSFQVGINHNVNQSVSEFVGKSDAIWGSASVKF